jgi:ribosomal protein S26
MLRVRHLVYAHNLRRTRRIHGPDLARGLDAPPADDEVILAPKFRFNGNKRVLHLAFDRSIGKVEESLVHKRRQGIERRKSLSSVHHPTILARTALAPQNRWVKFAYCVSFSVAFDIVAVRSSLSQLKDLPSIARFTVLNSTTEKT